MRLYRASTLLRLVLAIVLAAGVVALATSPSLSSPALGKDKQGQEHHGNSGKSDKGKHKGHGKSQERKDKNKDKGHDDSRGRKDKRKVKKTRQVAAQPIAQYTVQVDCSYDGSAGETTCLFDADNPPGGKKINLFDVPVEEICALVVGGDGRYVDPDPNTNVTGYRSTDSEGRMTLVFSGNVRTEASATYWIKAANNVFPATGPGLECRDPDQGQSNTQATLPPVATATPTPVTVLPEVTDSTGSIVVRSFSCPIAASVTDYDWYGQCTAQLSGVRYRLMRLDSETRDGLITSTDETGRAQFRSLQPGTYELTQAEGDWCFAQSDNVNADGNLTVTAGNRTTVWVFVCSGGS